MNHRHGSRWRVALLHRTAPRVEAGDSCGTWVCAALVALVVDALWRPYPVPLPSVTLLSTGLTVAALALAVARLRVAGTGPAGADDGRVRR
jgi:hypothetical protein